MAEHYTHGRQGQGSRHRQNNHNRRRRHRMPRPEPAPEKKPSLLTRLLRFFGFGKKNASKDTRKQKEGKRNTRHTAPQKVRVAKTNNHGGNPAAKSKRRATSTLPTRNARLYVGNLSYEATESELEDLFKGFGNVRSVEIIYNPRTYKSKGYAFIEMFQLDDARRAAEVLHGQPFMGRELMVSAASERPENNESPDTPAENEAAEPTPAESEATEPAAEPPSEQA